jgi:hypothetical protein
MQLDWHELRTNGCPALLRALKQIEHALAEQSQLLSVAEKQDKLILAAQLQQGADITDLQYLISEEIMARIAPPEDLREVVIHGRWTGRQPNENPDAAITTVGVPGDTWLTGPDWVTDYAAVSDATSTPPTANPAVADIDRQMAGVARVLSAFERVFVQDASDLTEGLS